MKQLTNEMMYQIFAKSDSQFDGRFYVGVTTTGIFCRPGCRARKAQAKNVRFFATLEQALQQGYRPCKLCHPEQLPQQMPAEISQVLQLLADEPQLMLTDAELQLRGYEPHTLRRWFLKYYGMTFQRYQRMLRINQAVSKIQQGYSVLDAAYDAGFASLSGFSDAVKRIFAASPTQVNRAVINLQRIDTPIGAMFAAADQHGVCLLEFADSLSLERELNLLAKTLQAVIIRATNPHLQLLQQELNHYFAGELQQFTVALTLLGTPFQKQVWQALMAIPYAEQWTYQQEANYLNKPKAVRAVANANGLNRISIIIPCHRVLGSDGTLTGYGGGVWRKQFLLELEQQHAKPA